MPYRPTFCRGCGAALAGDDPAPVRHQVVEIRVIVPVMIEHQQHRLVCPCCRTVITAVLPAWPESGRSRWLRFVTRHGERAPKAAKAPE